MKNIIDEFRGLNGRQPVSYWDDQVCGYCFAHNLAMSRWKNIYHAPDCYLNEWSEAVAVCIYNGERYEDIQRKLIFEVLAQSEGHRNIILNCSTLAYAFYTHDYAAYLTIRGK